MKNNLLELISKIKLFLFIHIDDISKIWTTLWMSGKVMNLCIVDASQKGYVIKI